MHNPGPEVLLVHFKLICIDLFMSQLCSVCHCYHRLLVYFHIHSIFTPLPVLCFHGHRHYEFVSFPYVLLIIFESLLKFYLHPFTVHLF